MEEIVSNLEMLGAVDVTNEDYRGEGKMFQLHDSSDDTNLLIRVFPDGEIEIYDGKSLKHIYYRKSKPTQGLFVMLDSYRGNLKLHYEALNK